MKTGTHTHIPTADAPLRHLLRPLLVVALFVTGAAHIPVIPEHLQEAPYIGALFIALSVTSFVLAAVIVVRDVPAVYVVTAIVTGLAIFAYLLSRAVGLPQIGDDIGNWFEPLGVVAVIAEFIAVLTAGGIALSGQRRRRSQADAVGAVSNTAMAAISSSIVPVSRSCRSRWAGSPATLSSSFGSEA